MKILKIMSYVITVPVTLILLFINLNPQFGSNPKKIEKKYYSGYSNYEDGEFKNKESTALFTDEMSFWDFFKTEINREPIKELIPLDLDINSFISNNSNEIELVWLGHSAFIININGVIIMLDPMLGNHAAPVPLPSLKRYSSQLAFDIDELEKIDFVVQIYVIFILLDFDTNSPYQTARRGNYRLTTKVLILGGGFSGFFTARHLKRLLKNSLCPISF